MDFGTTITALIILIICALPFIFSNISNRRKENQLLMALFSITGSRRENWHYELLHHFVIAINYQEARLAMAKKTPKELMLYTLDINDIRGCRVIASSHSVKNHDGQTIIVIDRIELAFTAKDKKQDEILWEIYNAQHDSSMLRGEAEFADKWASQVSDQITN